jgi:hypothetical protein
MAKELPYFRFTASEWLNDDISLESYELKGLFIDICAFYWFKDCSVSIALLHKRFSNATDLLHELRELEIIEYYPDESISIKFLNEQYDLLSVKRMKRSEAGRIGGLKKSSNAKAMLKQKPSYKDKEKDNYKNKEYIEFEVFWNLYDKKVSVSKCTPKWHKLTLEKQKAAIAYIPKYKLSQPDKKFRKNPETFLNNESWNDEIINSCNEKTRTINRTGFESDTTRRAIEQVQNGFK